MLTNLNYLYNHKISQGKIALISDDGKCYGAKVSPKCGVQGRVKDSRRSHTFHNQAGCGGIKKHNSFYITKTLKTIPLSMMYRFQKHKVYL
jgi:hypothetical protein